MNDRQRRWVRGSLLVLAGLGMLWSKGPRARLEPDGMLPSAIVTSESGFPDSLATWPAWLEANERRAGVTDTGVMKRVVFADSVPQRTTWSVVYLHGFSATRQEAAPLVEYIADSLHANLFEVRLQGHGLPADSLATASARQWIRDAESALTAGAALGDSVLLIGTSTGGTLAAWLATEPDSLRPALRRVVLISPNFAVRIGISIGVGRVYDAITACTSTDWRVAAGPPTRSCASRAVGTAGTWSRCAPASTSSAAATIACTRRESSRPVSPCVSAAAFLIQTCAMTKGSSGRRPLMGKFRRARSVWIP